MEKILDLISDGILLTMPIPCILFMILFSRYVNWKQNSLGRNLMYLQGALVAYLLLAITGVYFPDWTGREYVRFAIYIAMPSMLWAFTYQLIKARIEAKRQARAEVEEECKSKQQEEENA